MTMNTNMLRGLTAASALSLVLAASPALAGKLQIKPRVDPGQVVEIEIERMREFEKAVSLRLRTDPARVPSARVLELVRSIDMRDANGIKIERGYAIDAASDLVIGYSGGTAEIVKVHQEHRSLVVAALFKDEQGRITQPPAHSLAVYTTSGEPLCFAAEEVTAGAPPMSFALLLDRSGSMAPVIGEVRDAAKRFIADLPDHATCKVAAFDATASYERAEGFGTSTCASGNFPMSGLVAKGATNLFEPLAELYGWMNEPARADHQRAVIIITDGGVNENVEIGPLVKTLKGETLTFVYFLGGQDDTWLQGHADSYLTHSGDLKGQLGRYFNVVSDAFAKQTVLHLEECPAGGSPAPVQAGMLP